MYIKTIVIVKKNVFAKLFKYNTVEIFRNMFYCYRRKVTIIL